MTCRTSTKKQRVRYEHKINGLNENVNHVKLAKLSQLFHSIPSSNRQSYDNLLTGTRLQFIADEAEICRVLNFLTSTNALQVYIARFLWNLLVKEL